MNNPKTIFFILALFIITGMNSLTVNAAKPALTVKLDSSHITYHPVSNNKLNVYRQSSEFKYIDSEPEISSTLWSLIWRKIARIFGTIFSVPISSYLVYAIFIILFIILILSMIGVDVQSMFSRNNKMHQAIVDKTEENIHELDLEGMIQTEIEAGNYNLAVRYLYLNLLKILTNHQLINWQRDKTNHDYLSELSKSSYTDDFKIITLAYEYVWYGKFTCNPDNFGTIHGQFNALYKRLNA